MQVSFCISSTFISIITYGGNSYFALKIIILFTNIDGKDNPLKNTPEDNLDNLLIENENIELNCKKIQSIVQRKPSSLESLDSPTVIILYFAYYYKHI